MANKSIKLIVTILTLITAFGCSSPETIEVKIPPPLSEEEVNQVFGLTDSELTTNNNELPLETNAVAPDAPQQQNTTEASVPAEQASVSQVVNGYVLVRRERQKLDGTFVFADEFEHDYANNRIIRTTSPGGGDRDLRPFSVSSYDEVGNRTYVESADTPPSLLSSKIEFLYDTAGFLRTENGYFLDNGRQYSSINYQYHPDGRVEEKRNADDGVRVAMTYNDQNQLILTTRYFTGSSFIDPSTYQFEHVPNTDLIRQVGLVDETGASVNGFTVFNRDGNGNVISTELFDADGNPKSIDRYYYEQSPEPVYNFWLHIFRFFPEDARVALLGL